jgi:hypothetical protein
VFCFLEGGDSGFTRHGGKPREKLFERLSALQIIEESLDWDSRSTKHRSSAKNIRVFGDDSHETIVSRRMKPLIRVEQNRTLPTAASLKTAGMRPPPTWSAAARRRFSVWRVAAP